MKTIYKYPLQSTGDQTIAIPRDAQILCVQTQRDTPCLWALVDTEAPEQHAVHIRIYGTGHPVAKGIGHYIGTYQLLGGDRVFHCFYDRPKESAS